MDQERKADELTDDLLGQITGGIGSSAAPSPEPCPYKGGVGLCPLSAGKSGLPYTQCSSCTRRQGAFAWC